MMTRRYLTRKQGSLHHRRYRAQVQAYRHLATAESMMLYRSRSTCAWYNLCSAERIKILALLKARACQSILCCQANCGCYLCQQTRPNPRHGASSSPALSPTAYLPPALSWPQLWSRETGRRQTRWLYLSCAAHLICLQSRQDI